MNITIPLSSIPLLPALPDIWMYSPDVIWTVQDGELTIVVFNVNSLLFKIVIQLDLIDKQVFSKVFRKGTNVNKKLNYRLRIIK